MYCFLRRCPLWPMKLKVKRFVRVTKGVSHQILKNQKNYCNKAIEIVLDSESSQLPFWKGFSGTYLIDEIVLFLLFPDEEIFSGKYSIRMLTKLLDLILYRFLIPFFVHTLMEYLHSIFEKNQ